MAPMNAVEITLNIMSAIRTSMRSWPHAQSRSFRIPLTHRTLPLKFVPRQLKRLTEDGVHSRHHRHRDESDDTANDDCQRGRQHRNHCLGLVIRFSLVAFRHGRQRMVEVTGLLTDCGHLDHQREKKLVSPHRAGQAGAGDHSLLQLGERLLHCLVCGALHDERHRFR